MTPDMSTPRNVAVVGNHLPRQCGIATFTTDICEALAAEMPSGQVFAVAMDDVAEGYDYPERVRLQLRANVAQDYSAAADFLNFNNADLVLVQHEYGIYGGPAGANVVRMMRQLKCPVITTMHTVLSHADAEKRRVTEGIIERSNRIVVMSHHAKDLLVEIYGAPREKVVTIPHGIPDLPFVDPNFYKDLFAVEGKKVMLTFGLLSPGKGIEVVLKALPDIVKHHPDVVYIVLGATHPNIRRERGEEYRIGLKQLVHKLGMQNHVMFIDRFVPLEELVKYLGAADLYITPYHNVEQITSGTLAYALGAGKAVLSTPYRYAVEVLDEERGIIFAFNDPRGLAGRVNALFENPDMIREYGKRGYRFGRSMIWSEVARSHVELFREVLHEQSQQRRSSIGIFKIHITDTELPEIDLRHLKMMTDGTGILQHAAFATPNRSFGYCTDDNARALIAAASFYHLQKDEEVLPLVQTYLSFLLSAFGAEKGRFRNFMDYDRRWAEEIGSEDAHGRALWALGVTVSLEMSSAILGISSRLFVDALPAVQDFVFPRPWAFAILGIHAYLKKYRGDVTIKRMRKDLALRLLEMFRENSAGDWPWCEDTLTYANARIPQALIVSGWALSDAEMLETGLDALRWLLKIQTGEEGQLSIIGNKGWKKRGEHAARFDQQAVDVHALVDACVDAYKLTGDRFWVEESLRCFEWFLGGNDLHTAVYDFSTGGCRDGLQSSGLNENQGAESTLAWLLSLLGMYALPDEAFRAPEESHEMAEMA